MIHIVICAQGIPEFRVIKNPDYTGTYVFNNDHSALLTDQYSVEVSDNPLFQTQAVRGSVVLFVFPRS